MNHADSILLAISKVLQKPGRPRMLKTKKQVKLKIFDFC